MTTTQIPVICRKVDLAVIPITEVLPPDAEYEVIDDRFAIHPYLGSAEEAGQQSFWTITHQPSGWAIATFALHGAALRATLDLLDKLSGWDRTLEAISHDWIFMCLLKRIIEEYNGWCEMEGYQVV